MATLDLSRLPTIGEALRDATVSFRSRLALIEANRHRENGRWTFAEFRDQAERFGALLQKRGVKPGDRVAILMENQARWLISATGAMWAGCVLVPLDYKLSAGEQLDLMEHAEPRVLVTEHHRWRTLAALPQRAALERTLVLTTETPTDAEGGTHTPWELPETAEGFTPYEGGSREDTACIVYSSGTGGTPKGCMLSHKNYLVQAEVLGNMFPMDEGDRFFSVLPTNHAIDFMCGFLLPLLMGGAIVHQRTLRSEFLSATMQRYGVTHIALVPRLLKALKERVEEKLDDLPKWQRAIVDGLIDVNERATRRTPNHRLSSRLLRPIHDGFGKLRLIFTGGAFCEREVAEFFNRIGFGLAIGYGLTEACTVLTVNDLHPFRGDTVGAPVAGVELELRDKNAAGVGEVWVRSDTVMKGYLGAPELTEEAIVGGWLRTGDLGTVDAAGHLTLVGRAKNMIVTEGGKNVYPEDIEATFAEVDCEELCVFAANYIWPTGSLTGEQLIAVIRPRPGAGTDSEETSAAVADVARRNRRLSDYKRLSGYVLWDREFPRTASLKVKRQVLATELRQSLSREDALQPLT